MSNEKNVCVEACERVSYKHESLDNSIHTIWNIRDRLSELISRINNEPCGEGKDTPIVDRGLREVLTEGRAEIDDCISQCLGLISDLNSALFD